jgi:chaperonin cofactor prefoldin
MDQELVQYLDERFRHLDERFGGIEQRLDGHDRRFESIDRRFDEVNGRIEEAKRHSGVLVEGLRHELHLVVEGFATFVEGRYAQDQARIDERFRETQALIRASFEHLARQDDELRQRDDQLSQRVDTLERKPPN